MRYPLDSFRVTQRFMENGHWGIDLAQPTGTPVKSPVNGTVISVDTNPDYIGGLYVIVRQDEAPHYEHYTGHHSTIAVSVGQRVGEGQIIAHVGATGKATGPHVHYQIRHKNAGALINPESLLGTAGNTSIPVPKPVQTTNQTEDDMPATLEQIRQLYLSIRGQEPSQAEIDIHINNKSTLAQVLAGFETEVNNKLIQQDQAQVAYATARNENARLTQELDNAKNATTELQTKIRELTASTTELSTAKEKLSTDLSTATTELQEYRDKELAKLKLKEDKSVVIEQGKALARNGVLGIISAGVTLLIDVVTTFMLDHSLGQYATITVAIITYLSAWVIDKYIHHNDSISANGITGF